MADKTNNDRTDRVASSNSSRKRGSPRVSMTIDEMIGRESLKTGARIRTVRGVCVGLFPACFNPVCGLFRSRSCADASPQHRAGSGPIRLTGPSGARVESCGVRRQTAGKQASNKPQTSRKHRGSIETESASPPRRPPTTRPARIVGPTPRFLRGKKYAAGICAGVGCGGHGEGGGVTEARKLAKLHGLGTEGAGVPPRPHAYMNVARLEFFTGNAVSIWAILLARQRRDLPSQAILADEDLVAGRRRRTDSTGKSATSEHANGAPFGGVVVESSRGKERVSKTSCATGLRRFELRDGNIGHTGHNLRAQRGLRRLHRERKVFRHWGA